MFAYLINCFNGIVSLLVSHPDIVEYVTPNKSIKSTCFKSPIGGRFKKVDDELNMSAKDFYKEQREAEEQELGKEKNK